MKYLLDTNICIYFLNQKDQHLTDKLKRINPKDIAICSIVKAELIYGAIKSARTEENLAIVTDFAKDFASLPFDDIASQVYGRIRFDLERKGSIIGPNDLLIASIARANNLCLVTNNTSEFSRIDSLEIENWTVNN